MNYVWGKASLGGVVLAISLVLTACGDDGVDTGDTTATDGTTDTGTDSTTDSGTDNTTGDDTGGDDTGASATIDENGGTVETDIGEGETSVEIPGGAVEESVEVRVEPVEATEVAPIEGAAEFALDPVAFLPHGTTFDTPVTISFTAPNGFGENAVMARLDDENDTEWELLETTVEGNTISASVTSFSIYAVIEGTLCHQADPDTDGDDVCDSTDLCFGSDNVDADQDGVCDSQDLCTGSDNVDADEDGICDSLDVCFGSDNVDSDEDGVCDSVDPCTGSDNVDSDEDGICDSEDACPQDPLNDSDGNQVCDGSEARISGVMLKNGVPVVGANIVAYTPQQVQVGSATTDANGAYFMGELPAGTLDVYGRSPTECAGGAIQVTVALGELVNGDIAANCF